MSEAGDVAGAIRRFYDDHAIATEGVTLKAMVPMSVRADAERGALGNRVTTMYAPLPVHERDPVERLRIVTAAMQGLKESGQAVGAEVLTRLTDFAPPTIPAQASRLQGVTPAAISVLMVYAKRGFKPDVKKTA